MKIINNIEVVIRCKGCNYIMKARLAYNTSQHPHQTILFTESCETCGLKMYERGKKDAINAMVLYSKQQQEKEKE